MYSYILDKLIIDFTGKELFILILCSILLSFSIHHLVAFLLDLIQFIFDKIPFDIVGIKK